MFWLQGIADNAKKVWPKLSSFVENVVRFTGVQDACKDYLKKVLAATFSKIVK